MLYWMISHMMVTNGDDTGLNLHRMTTTTIKIHRSPTTTTNNTKSIAKIKTHHVGYSLLLTCALFECNGIVSIWCYWVFWWFCFERRNLILDTVEETLFLHSAIYFSIGARESTALVVVVSKGCCFVPLVEMDCWCWRWYCCCCSCCCSNLLFGKWLLEKMAKWLLQKIVDVRHCRYARAQYASARACRSKDSKIRKKDSTDKIENKTEISTDIIRLKFLSKLTDADRESRKHVIIFDFES